MKRNLIIGSLIVSSLVQYASPAFANKETIGNIIGGIIGGAVGSNVGKGNGNKAAIIIGAIAGTMIGGEIGRDLDEADRRALEEAQRHCLNGGIGNNVDWNGRTYGSRTGAYGSFRTTREGYNRGGEVCREYHSEIYSRGRTERTSGYACSRRDGSWYEVRETEVTFGGRHGGGYQGPGRHEPSRPPRYPDVPVRPNFPPPPPAYSGYQGNAQVNQVTRRSGGEWVRLSPNPATTLQSIEVRALSAAVKVHEAVLHTSSGRQIPVYELSSTPALYAGQAVMANLNAGEMIMAIDLRVESMGGYSDILVTATSSMTYPSLSVSRF